MLKKTRKRHVDHSLSKQSKWLTILKARAKAIEAAPAQQIEQLEGIKARLLLQRQGLENKLRDLEARIASTGVQEK